MTTGAIKHGNIPQDQLLQAVDFQDVINGMKADLFTLQNEAGCIAQVTTYGARLLSLWVPDNTGKYKDVVLGFSSLREVIKADKSYYGATVGRYANRIAFGQFELEGLQYRLATNDGANHLHGGNQGFESKVWKVKSSDTSSVELTYLSIHQEEGYPGNLTTCVKYHLSDENKLVIEYTAKTDQTTIINLTNHAYFNLKGEGDGTIKDHLLQINADQFTSIGHGSIPTGKIVPVEGTPLDFSKMTQMGAHIDDEFGQLGIGNGYDHNYVLRGKPGENRLAARVKEPSYGLVMEVYTDQPGLQFYTGNSLDGSDVGKSGKPYLSRFGFCLETQHYPDSPNRPEFPSVVLRPHETFKSITSYKFLTE